MINHQARRSFLPFRPKVVAALRIRQARSRAAGNRRDLGPLEMPLAGLRTAARLSPSGRCGGFQLPLARCARLAAGASGETNPGCRPTSGINISHGWRRHAATNSIASIDLAAGSERRPPARSPPPPSSESESDVRVCNYRAATIAAGLWSAGRAGPALANALGRSRRDNAT